nr:hypothetical protein [Angustibacter aerolatus]
MLNTDAERYGGSGVGNLGAVEAVDEAGTGCRPRRRSCCRRWVRSGSGRRSPPTTEPHGCTGQRVVRGELRAHPPGGGRACDDPCDIAEGRA